MSAILGKRGYFLTKNSRLEKGLYWETIGYDFLLWGGIGRNLSRFKVISWANYQNKINLNGFCMETSKTNNIINEKSVILERRDTFLA